MALLFLQPRRQIIHLVRKEDLTFCSENVQERTVKGEVVVSSAYCLDGVKARPIKRGVDGILL